MLLEDDKDQVTWCHFSCFLRSTDTYIAYLPQAHILELIAEIACMYMGARIGFSSNKTIFDGSSGLADKCLGDIRTLKPTSK